MYVLSLPNENLDSFDSSVLYSESALYSLRLISVACKTGFLSRSIVQDPLCESYRRLLRLLSANGLRLRSVPAFARFANSL